MIGGQTTVATRPREGEPISGRSLKRIAWSRFRRDPVGMASLVVIALVVLVAVTTPLLTHLLGLRPNELHDGLIGDGALPRYGPLHSGITWRHPLGVEPATGRDILAPAALRLARLAADRDPGHAVHRRDRGVDRARSPRTRSPGSKAFILPWCTLAAVYAAFYARLTRNQMLDTLGEDFTRTARAKGLHRSTVLFKHALRASLTPSRCREWESWRCSR